MTKILFKFFLASFLVFSMVGCEDSYVEEQTTTQEDDNTNQDNNTNVKNCTYTGTNSVTSNKGEAYTDPGVTVVDGNGDSVNDVVTDTSNVDINTVGIYTVTFSSASCDNGASRTVSIIESTQDNNTTEDDNTTNPTDDNILPF
jgi:hypothetical protein